LTKAQLYEELSYVNHSRAKRLHYAKLLMATPELTSKVLEILFEVDHKISCRAAWILEFACNEDLKIISPHLECFTTNMPRVHLDAAVRPVAKICEYLVNAYYGKTDHFIKTELTTVYKERIVAACFDWMINDEKVAPKAYAMKCLFALGKDFDWIHPELVTILQRDYHHQSSGYKARARHILKALS